MSDQVEQKPTIPLNDIHSSQVPNTLVSNNEEECIVQFYNSNNLIEETQDSIPQEDALSNTQLDNISNMADDLESLGSIQNEIPELNGQTSSNTKLIFTKVQRDSTNESSNSPSNPSLEKTTAMSTHSFISKWKRKKISLCFGGKIEIVPCLSVLAILLSILALISIALLVALPFNQVKELPILDLMSKRASLFASYIAMRDMLRLGVENKGNFDPYSTYYYYYQYKSNFNRRYTNFTEIIPSKFSHDFLKKPLETYPIFTEHWDKMVLKVVSFRVVNGTNRYFLNRTLQAEARMQLYSVEYAQHFNEFQDSFYDMQDKIFEMCNNADNLAKNSGIATIVLVCFSLAVILPTILIIFLFAIRKDRSNERNLHNANHFMLKDTMANPSMRLDFKKYCKECKMENQYFLLEKIQYYKEYALESYDVQMNLYEITNNIVRKQSIDMNDKNSILIYKVAKEAEKKLAYFERMKYETAFEIVENFHDPPSNVSSLTQEIKNVLDMYNNQRDIFEDTDLLPSKLFETLEHELGQSLAKTHIAFKSTSGLNVSTNIGNMNHGVDIANSKPLLDQSMIQSSTTEDNVLSTQMV